jgi:hypothetical protein
MSAVDSSFVPLPRAETDLGWWTWRGRHGRMRRYAAAMGWELGPEGELHGSLDGFPVRVTHDRAAGMLVTLSTPWRLPWIQVEPRERAAADEDSEDGLTELRTGDPLFDDCYRLRAEDEWLARVVVDIEARRALLAAPEQSWVMAGRSLCSAAAETDEPLDLLARAVSLRAVLSCVPAEAYPDPDTFPDPSALVAVVRRRRENAGQWRPSMSRYT